MRRGVPEMRRVLPENGRSMIPAPLEMKTAAAGFVRPAAASLLFRWLFTN
jgi:hypothetical protein